MKDVIAMRDFYEAMKDEPYQAQIAAVDWLRARFQSDEALRHPVSGMLRGLGEFGAQAARERSSR